jgi:putative membrane protein (TIGR04086 family)
MSGRASIMPVRQRETPGAKGSIRPVVTGLIVGVAASALMLLAFSAWITFHDTPQGLIEPMAVLSLCTGGFLSGFACARLTRGSGLKYGALCGAALALLVMIAGLVSGTGGIGVSSLYRLASTTLPAMFGGVLGVNLRKKPGRPGR